eukprot:CAMPEP_0180136260 /NCGR_PEP_ID=MMETSP0986-20121125/11383_1 /TAXON_ID=697907 /ORGANISM="non described non described, Strain CCMP2293" /LENGTH=258 /DNA_ID=CAMNT_0022077241 /DNA_START=190 /DNA_END=966 /DNA_ORIENTATION=-
MGVGAIGTYLVMDEVEHHRCGAGVMLETNPQGEIQIGWVMPKGAADGVNLQEGDIVLRVGDMYCKPGTSIAEVSDAIRGREWSEVSVFVRKRNGANTVVNITRQRVPGGKTEMLGALWQSGSASSPAWATRSPMSKQEKVAKLKELRHRGSLSEDEFDQAMATVNGTGQVKRQVSFEESMESGMTGFLDAMNEDVAKLSRWGSSPVASPAKRPPAGASAVDARTGSRALLNGSPVDAKGNRWMPGKWGTSPSGPVVWF